MNTNTFEADKLEVGIDVIDNQHKVLFDLIKDLDNAHRNGVNIGVIDVLLGVFRDYVFMHFQTEEDHLAKDDDYTNHCLEHYTLVKQLNTFIHEFKNNRMKGQPPPSDFLERWLLDHIEKFDKPGFADESAIESLSALSDPVDSFEPKFEEKRQHRRIRGKDVVDGDIQVHCYNATKLKNGTAEIVNLSSGGLQLRSSNNHEVGDLLVVSCKIGSNFKMKEKVKVQSVRAPLYGVQFISPARETLVFITELYGSLHMSKTNF